MSKSYSFCSNKPKSSQVVEYGFDPANKVLRVSFKTGGTYLYHGVGSELFAKMKSAESVGKFMHAHVKGKFKHAKI